MGIRALSAIIRPTEFFSAFVVIFNFIISIGFSCRPDIIKCQHSSKPLALHATFMRPQIFAYLLLSLTTYGQTKDNSQKASSIPKVDTAQTHTKNMSDYSPRFDKAHPNAKRLMNEDFYFSTIDETAPFGNDDGADTYAGFKDWRQTHKSDSPKEFLLEQIDRWDYPKFDIYETDIEKLKPYLTADKMNIQYMTGVDQAIVAVAFGQLYLEGTIDKDFKQLAKTTIDRELLPSILNLWGDTYKLERQTKLKKMLAILNS